MCTDPAPTKPKRATRIILRYGDGQRYVVCLALNETFEAPEPITVLAFERRPGVWHVSDDDGRAAVAWFLGQEQAAEPDTGS
jgi:hypothetical protein